MLKRKKSGAKNLQSDHFKKEKEKKVIHFPIEYDKNDQTECFFSTNFFIILITF